MRLALLVLSLIPAALVGCVTAPPAPAPVGVQRLDTGAPAPDTGLAEVTPPR